MIICLKIYCEYNNKVLRPFKNRDHKYQNYQYGRT